MPAELPADLPDDASDDLPDEDRDDEEVEDEEEDEEEDDRSYPIGPTARFTIGGKPLELEEFISTTTGKLADRERVEPQPQSPPLTKSVVWASRRPLTGD